MDCIIFLWSRVSSSITISSHLIAHLRTYFLNQLIIYHHVTCLDHPDKSDFWCSYDTFEHYSFLTDDLTKTMTKKFCRPPWTRLSESETIWSIWMGWLASHYCEFIINPMMAPQGNFCLGSHQDSFDGLVAHFWNQGRAIAEVWQCHWCAQNQRNKEIFVKYV